ncbi:DNA-binding CsgD family transcriptional regulator [Labrenzia sp. EL_142]|nr:DNA-binding CsgD family transcriptional regulator [Labrenzia sp. EL_142]
MKLEEQIRTASEAFSTMLETHFEAWKLSKPECAIARLILQGYEISDCADILKLSRTDVLSHQKTVFAKVGVSNWLQIKTFLTDQLFSGSKRGQYCPFIWSKAQENSKIF